MSCTCWEPWTHWLIWPSSDLLSSHCCRAVKAKCRGSDRREKCLLVWDRREGFLEEVTFNLGSPIGSQRSRIPGLEEVLSVGMGNGGNWHCRSDRGLAS
jgi:hypothetical protein